MSMENLGVKKKGGKKKRTVFPHSVTCLNLTAMMDAVGLCQPWTYLLARGNPSRGSFGSSMAELLTGMCRVLNSSAELKSRRQISNTESIHTDREGPFLLQPTESQLPVCRFHQSGRQWSAWCHRKLWQWLLQPASTAVRSVGLGKQQTILHCEEVEFLSISKSLQHSGATLDTHTSHICVVKDSVRQKDNQWRKEIRE